MTGMSWPRWKTLKSWRVCQVPLLQLCFHWKGRLFKLSLHHCNCSILVGPVRFRKSGCFVLHPARPAGRRLAAFPCCFFLNGALAEAKCHWGERGRGGVLVWTADNSELGRDGKQSGNWETKEVVQDIPLSAIECISHFGLQTRKILKEGIPFNNMWQIGGSQRP